MARAGCSMSLLSLECALSPVLVYFSICWSPVELPVGAGPPIEPKNQYHIHCDKIEEHRIKAFLLTCCCISKSNVVFAVELGHWTLVQCCAPGENWFGVCRSSVLLEREEGLLIVLHAHDRPAPRLLRRALLSKRDKAFRMTTKPLEMTAKGVETTGKPFGMTGKGVGNRSSRSVREENSEFGRVAPQGDPAKRSPTRPSLAVFAWAFSSANHNPLDHRQFRRFPCRVCGS